MEGNPRITKRQEITSWWSRPGDRRGAAPDQALKGGGPKCRQANTVAKATTWSTLYEDLERRRVPKEEMRACGEAIGAGLEDNDQIVLIRARHFDLFSK